MSIILPGVQTIISAPRFSSAIWMKNVRKKRVETGKTELHVVLRTLGAFHSTNNSEIFETVANGTEIFPGKVSRKPGNC